MKIVLLKIFSLCASISIACSAFAAGQKELKPVKYVFLFIGDGMSIPQRMMTEEYLRLNGEEGLVINAFTQKPIYLYPLKRLFYNRLCGKRNCNRMRNQDRQRENRHRHKGKQAGVGSLRRKKIWQESRNNYQRNHKPCDPGGILRAQCKQRQLL